MRGFFLFLPSLFCYLIICRIRVVDAAVRCVFCCFRNQLSIFRYYSCQYKRPYYVRLLYKMLLSRKRHNCFLCTALFLIRHCKYTFIILFKTNVCINWPLIFLSAKNRCSKRLLQQSILNALL